MAKLTEHERQDLPDGDFAGPGRTYPIHDEEHARLAVEQVPKSGDSKLIRRVRMAVKHRYPDIEIEGLGKE